LKERIVLGFDWFVLPFSIAMTFIFVYIIYAVFKIFKKLTKNERISVLSHILSFRIFGTIWLIIKDTLLHVKIFKRNFWLGYMHSSIAFGWFMLILIGHIEVMLYTPHRTAFLYYPVFFRYFVMEVEATLRGAFFFFMMDLFLLIVLSGLLLALIKRFNSKAVGMKRTTILPLTDKIAMFSLWAIFPLRLLAESFTANISGGSFLTKGINSILSGYVNYNELLMPAWWSYSISLSIFLFVLPFSRYMHIPTEAFLILLRRSGIKSSSYREGFANAELFSCSSCGICIDVCPMSYTADKYKSTSAYVIKNLRFQKGSTDLSIIDDCLMCRKCVEACPVEIDSSRLKLFYKQLKRSSNSLTLNLPLSEFVNEKNLLDSEKCHDIIYYSGCMTKLTPSIYSSFDNIMRKAGIEYLHIDKEETLCCGRPLLLSGNMDEFKKVVNLNSKIIASKHPKRLIVSCPICLKMFREEYALDNIEIMHHSQYILSLVKSNKIELKKSLQEVVYHDPCELGRGLDIYDEPRELISLVANLKESKESRQMSICCGGSLASTNLSIIQKEEISIKSLNNLTNGADLTLVTSCPLCYKTFSQINSNPTMDIAQIVNNNL
jgi:Fe-S oxidoreductase